MLDPSPNRGSRAAVRTPPRPSVGLVGQKTAGQAENQCPSGGSWGATSGRSQTLGIGPVGRPHEGVIAKRGGSRRQSSARRHMLPGAVPRERDMASGGLLVHCSSRACGPPVEARLDLDHGVRAHLRRVVELASSDRMASGQSQHGSRGLSEACRRPPNPIGEGKHRCPKPAFWPVIDYRECATSRT